MRRRFGQVFGQELARGLIIQYGGSVEPDNAASLLCRTGVAGAAPGAKPDSRRDPKDDLSLNAYGKHTGQEMLAEGQKDLTPTILQKIASLDVGGGGFSNIDEIQAGRAPGV